VLGQTPEHDAPDAMQAPAHSFIPDGQVPPHVVPSQVAVPPVGTEQAVQLEPQELTEVLLAHELPQAWYPVLQVNPQAVPSHVAVPCAGIGHAEQEVVPQEFGLAFGWQIPEQSCVPEAQRPAHDAPASMQAPAHSFIPDGQVPPHIFPSQVAVPPVGTGQGTQAVPQLAASLLLTQIPTQLCVPAPQTLPASLPPAPASAGPPSPPRPMPPPAPIARSVMASVGGPLSLPLIGMSRERADVQPPATIIIRRPATRAVPSKRMEVEIIALPSKRPPGLKISVNPAWGGKRGSITRPSGTAPRNRQDCVTSPPARRVGDPSDSSFPR
jgi:hypothetical protein